MTISTFRRSSSSAPSVRLAVTTRALGDFHPRRVRPELLHRRRDAVVRRPWIWLDQVHGAQVVRLDTPTPAHAATRDGAAPGSSVPSNDRVGNQSEVGCGAGSRHGPGDLVKRSISRTAAAAVGAVRGTQADGVFTTFNDIVLSVWLGDCAPIALIGAERDIGLVHAGWRGLARGVVDAAVAVAVEPIEKVILGPTIGPCCYEFDIDDARLVAQGVRAPLAAIVEEEAAAGESAGRRVGEDQSGHKVRLDMTAAVSAAFAYHGLHVTVLGGCTGCDRTYFSHRVRGERERHTVALWQESL